MLKKIFLSTIAILFVSGFWGCQEQIDIEAEKEAIKEVIQAQCDAVLALSYEGEAAVWAQTDYIVRRDARGWDSISAYYQEFFQSWRSDTMDFEGRVFTTSNFDIHVNGTFASVFHDQHLEYVLNGEEHVSDGSEHKYMEKIGGEWKIITLF